MNEWQPATEAQRMALDCPADILFFGGSAGSLKSHTLLLDALQERENPRLRALICRESFPNLSDLIDKSFRLYKPLGAEYNEQKKKWTFPSGAEVKFGYMDADRAVYQYWGMEYSWIGFDESTFHTEFQVRTLMSRLRSTDTSLKLRVRLASNPGNSGASWHQQIFLRGACPVHEPDKCAIPGKLYRDRVWPSDGKSIPFSVAFIPGKLSDHKLLQSDYAENLRSMSGNLADQLLEGCWCQLQGAYFGKIWNKQKMVVPPAQINEQYWWQSWLSLDYGTGKSYAAAGLFVKTPPLDRFPNGRILKVGELCVPNTSAHEFGELVVEHFIKPALPSGSRRSIGIAYLDPANFNPDYDIRRGTGGHSVSDQLNEVFEPYGLACRRASNDRIGGWQHLYRVLDSGEFAISEDCAMTAEAIRTRVHDEKKPGDVLKVSGDPLDDVADETRYGLYSFINDSEKPRSMVIAEKVKPYLDSGDLTSLIARLPDIQHETSGRPQPIPLGRRGVILSRRFR